MAKSPTVIGIKKYQKALVKIDSQQQKIAELESTITKLTSQLKDNTSKVVKHNTTESVVEKPEEIVYPQKEWCEQLLLKESEKGNFSLVGFVAKEMFTYLKEQKILRSFKSGYNWVSFIPKERMGVLRARCDHAGIGIEVISTSTQS